ncbi:MAG TPA: hypothetical protein VKT77_14695 [Chthonomonadaceae bacterium]|nr:hypothetical protein [Chthonomonadaceae bacterium]
MALFPKDDVRPEELALRRRAVTQESGTKRLVMGFIVLLLVWVVAWRVNDYLLQRKVWPAVAADPAGLTVVGTLDRRGSYDTNLFRVVQSEGAARAEVTDFGWDGIFAGHHGPLTSKAAGDAIRAAIGVDGETGYAMLQPILQAEVRSEMGDAAAFGRISPDYPISTTVATTDTERKQPHNTRRTKTLRELIDYFKSEGAGTHDAGEDSTPGSSNTGEHVEHGLAIPAAMLIQSCPVVLAGRHFVSGRVEEHPEAILGGITYSVWLDLTPEGRSRFFQWSHNHVNEHLLLILNGSIVANGRMAMTMDVNTWEISNLKDGVAAHQLVDFVNAQHARGR